MKKIAMLTSGGDASGMNAVIRAVTRYAKFKGLEVLGFYEGFKGLINNDFVVLNLNSVGGIIDRGGTFLYSARSEEFKTEEGMQKAIVNLNKNKVDGLIIIGGDGSFRGANDLHNRGVQVVGIPGTIDNDIAGTDYSIGFDTALNVIIDLISKIRDTASSHDRLFVIEVMGKSSGIIAVSAGLACAADYILIPEVEVDLVKIANKIKNHREGKRHTLIVVAEGAAKAIDVASSIKLLVGHEVRVSVLGHIQRGGSPSALDRLLAAEFARKAVDLLLDGKSDCITAIEGNIIKSVPLDYVLSRKKNIDKELYELAHILSK
ncbi:MAG: 6-phosphofructokinase [Actinobacteria bacterium]|nr:6-phosphofructokinase [Actinomycetota bacterium]MBM3712995.1 6-phosphofructokinase [Actinomycetota bacterium]